MRRHLTTRLTASLFVVALAAGSVGGVAARVGATEPSGGHGSSVDGTARSLAGSPTVQTAGRRGSVDVQRLSRHDPTLRPTMVAPRLGRSGSPIRRVTPDGPAAALAAPPPATTLATLNADGPAKQPGFDGLATTSGPSTGLEPPDPWLAVGPDHVVQVVNTTMRVTDRQGGSETSVALADFFQLPMNPPTFNTDPRVIYDSLHGRWFMTEVSWDCDTSGAATYGTGYIDFAVSRTADPTGLWDGYYVSSQDSFADFAAPGTSTDKIGIGANQYQMQAGATCLDNATPFGNPGRIVVIDWSDLTNGGNLTYQGDELNVFTPRFAVQSPATSPRLHIVGEFSDLGVVYEGITGTVTGGNLGFNGSYLLTDLGVVAPFVEPLPPNQPGPDVVTTDIDSRPTDAIWQNDRLVFVSTNACTPTGDSTLRDCVRVTELNTTGVSATVKPTLKQDFLVAENGKDSYMGGVGLSGDGTLHVGWTRSSTTAGDFPSSYSAHQTLGDALGSLSAKESLSAGTASYDGDRWGDYVGVAQDPQVPSQVWDGNQYSGGTEWKTTITPLRTQGTTYVPITPLRVLDSRGGTGLAGAFTSSVARTWQVAGVGAIPADAVAVTGNVTVTGQQAAGYIAVTPTPTNTPPSSSLNFPLGDVRANNVTVPLSATGSLSATYKAGSGKKTHIVFDVTGYFLADDTGATFTPMTPVRALDTRSNTGLAGKFTSGTPRTLTLAGTNGIPPTATAITGNLTVTQQSAAGYLAVTKAPTATPPSSTLNFPVSDNRANGLFAPLDGAGALSIVYKSGVGATTQVILDVTGYFEPGTAGLRFVPLNPGRIMETRGSGGLTGLAGPFSANVARILPVDGHWGVPVGAAAVTGVLTVSAQTGAGYVTVSPDAPPPGPPTSTLNFPIGDVRANGLVATLNGSGDTYLVYVSGSGRTTHLVLDLSGYFE